MTVIRTFHLERVEDETGVSGPGRVAEGAVFSDGEAVIHWVVGEYRTTVPHPKGVESVIGIHGHHGKTRIVWHTDDDAMRGVYAPQASQR